MIDMPLNSAPCTTTSAELLRKAAAAAGPNKTWVDVGLWAGLVPANARDPAALKALAAGGVLGFKAFMSPSGIDDFPNVSPEDVQAALPTIRGLGLPLLVHAELVDADLPAPVGGLRDGWAGTSACCPARKSHRPAGAAVLRVILPSSTCPRLHCNSHHISLPHESRATHASTSPGWPPAPAASRRMLCGRCWLRCGPPPAMQRSRASACTSCICQVGGWAGGQGGRVGC